MIILASLNYHFFSILNIYIVTQNQQSRGIYKYRYAWEKNYYRQKKLIFHWKPHSPVFFKSLFRTIFEALRFLATEKSEVSSANNLGFDAKLSGKSLIQIKTNSGPRIEPWGTPASALPHEEY